MKNSKITFTFLVVFSFVLASGCLLSSCDDWTEVKEVNYIVNTPDKQNPELYAKYAEAVRNYKARKHYAVCISFENGRSGEGERSYLRSIPDSIDAVILTNADAMTSADLEDYPVLQQNFATKILFGFDLTALKKEAEESGKDFNSLFDTSLDKMLTVIADNGLDGASIAYTGTIEGDEGITAIRNKIIEKIRPLSNARKTFFFEGNPLFIPEADRDVFSCYIIKTTSVANAKQLQLLIKEATDFAGIPADKLLISADPELMTKDNDNTLVMQVPFFSEQVINSGPIGGLLIQNAIMDYHTNPNVSYYETRNAIQLLNPSPSIK